MMYAPPPRVSSHAASKGHVRGEHKAINNSHHISGRSIIKSAGMAALILSAATHSASAASISGTQSTSSKAQQRASDGIVSSASVLTSLWGLEIIDDTKTKWVSTSSSAGIGNRLLQEDHDHAHEDEEDHVTEAAVEEEHAHEDEHEDENQHDAEDEHEDEDLHDAEDDHEDEHLHTEEEADDHDHDALEGHGHSSHEGHEDEFLGTFTMANESKSNGEPWGAVIGATLLVNLATFSGVLIIVLPAIYRGFLKYRSIPVESSPAAHGNGRFFDIVIPGFAVGALVATAVFLVFPESVKYLSGEGHAGHEDEEAAGAHNDHSGHGHRNLQEDSHAGEGSAAAKFGCSVLGGFLLPFVFAILFHHSDPSQDGEDTKKEGREGSVTVMKEEEDCETCHDKPGDVEMGVAVAAESVDDPQDSSKLIQKGEDATPEVEMCACDVCEEGAINEPESEEKIVNVSFVNKRLCASILLGDGFHNFADGFFIAAAFRSCSVGVALSIMLVTLFHELAQELADFIVLIKFGGLPVWKALAFNFLSGLSVCLGGVIFLATKPTDAATGVILAMAGGVYINIAACETAPRMEGAMKGRGDRALMLSSIILGTIPIGLILLDHKHCG